MNVRNLLFKAVMPVAALGAATLIGCGGSSRTPVSTQTAAISGTFNAANLPRGASAASSLYTATAVALDGSGATVSGPVSSAGLFLLNLDTSKSWKITFVCATCTVKAVGLGFSGADFLPLAAMAGLSAYGFGTLTVAAPAAGTTVVTVTPIAALDFSNAAYAGAGVTCAACSAGAIFTGGLAFGAYASSGAGSAALAAGNAAAAGAVAAALTSVGVTTGVDTTAPTISSTSPAAGSSFAGNLTTASVTFSEAMTQTTTPNVNVVITNTTAGTVVQSSAAATSIGTVAWNTAGTVLTFTLTNGKDLTSGQAYSIALTFGGGSNGLKDLNGNALSLSGLTGTGITANASTGTVTIAFTASGADTTAPTISSTTPTANGTVAASTTSGTVTFSEAMNTTSGTATVTVANVTSGTTLLNNVASTASGAGTGSWNTAGTAFTYAITDTRRFDAGSQYTVSVTLSNFKDVAGNALTIAAPTGSTGVTVNGSTLTYTFTAQ